MQTILASLIPISSLSRQPSGLLTFLRFVRFLLPLLNGIEKSHCVVLAAIFDRFRQKTTASSLHFAVAATVTVVTCVCVSSYSMGSLHRPANRGRSYWITTKQHVHFEDGDKFL